jgi:hypothetical protein
LDWQTFYKIDVADATDDFWTELFQVGRTEDGNYEFSIWKLLCLEDDEPCWIEWESAEAVPASSILQELFEGSSDRGLPAEVTLEAALELLPFLPKDDADLVGKSIAASIQSDDNLRKGIPR